MVCVLFLAVCIYAVTHISTQNVNLSRPDTIVQMVNKVANNHSYDDLVLIKSSSLINKTMIYNMSIAEQAKLRNFLHRAVECPSDSVMRSNDSTCVYYIEHSPLTRVCCNENLDLVNLQAFEFTLERNNTLYLLENLTAKINKIVDLKDNETTSDKRLIIASFNDNIPNTVMQILDSNMCMQLEKFLITSISCNEGLGRFTGNLMCYRKISHQQFYMCCDASNLPKFLYFNNVMLKKHEIYNLMDILQNKKQNI